MIFLLSSKNDGFTRVVRHQKLAYHPGKFLEGFQTNFERFWQCKLRFSSFCEKRLTQLGILSGCKNFPPAAGKNLKKDKNWTKINWKDTKSASKFLFSVRLCFALLFTSFLSCFLFVFRSFLNLISKVSAGQLKCVFGFYLEPQVANLSGRPT